MYQSNRGRSKEAIINCSASLREPGDLTLAASCAAAASPSRARRRLAAGDRELRHVQPPPSPKTYALDPLGSQLLPLTHTHTKHTLTHITHCICIYIHLLL